MYIYISIYLYMSIYMYIFTSFFISDYKSSIHIYMYIEIHMYLLIYLSIYYIHITSGRCIECCLYSLRHVGKQHLNLTRRLAIYVYISIYISTHTRIHRYILYIYPTWWLLQAPPEQSPKRQKTTPQPARWVRRAAAPVREAQRRAQRHAVVA